MLARPLCGTDVEAKYKLANRDLPGYSCYLDGPVRDQFTFIVQSCFFFFLQLSGTQRCFPSTRQNKTKYVENDGAAGGPVIAAKLLSNNIGFLLRLSYGRDSGDQLAT